MQNYNNRVKIVGKAVTGVEYSHRLGKKVFYTFSVGIKRNSDTVDYIPVIVPEQTVCRCNETIRDETICIDGTYRSCNKQGDGKTHLLLNAYADEMKILDSADYEHVNDMYMDGFIVKEPVFRVTPLGREITDLLVAVNRQSGKSDYIPCICWGRNARFASTFEVGTHVQIWGRIQSREYMKRLSDTEMENRIAYEVSVSKIEL